MIWPQKKKLTELGLWGALVFLFVIADLSYKNTQQLVDANDWVVHTQQVLLHLEHLLSDVKDTEGSARQYVISGADFDLLIIHAATLQIDQEMSILTHITADNPLEQTRLQQLHVLLAQKIAWNNTLIRLREVRGFLGVWSAARTNRGTLLMNPIRDAIAAMEQEEFRLLQIRQEKVQLGTQRSILSLVLGTLLILILFVLVFYTLSHEIDLRGKTETALRSVNKELEAFSYSVSHDLRTPLRAMDGYSKELLQNLGPTLETQNQADLNRIRAAASRMGQLIDDLLNLSRLTRVGMVKEDIDVSMMAEKILQDLQRSSPDRKAEFVIVPHVRVSADPKLLQIALQNLLANAWKFTEKGPVAKIQVGLTERDGKKVFFIRDNGVGFDMAYKGKLFGAFQRLHNADEFPGTGIGLATVQRIVHRHGGTIWAEAKVNEGATFYISLPSL